MIVIVKQVQPGDSERLLPLMGWSVEAFEQLDVQEAAEVYYQMLLEFGYIKELSDTVLH